MELMPLPSDPISPRDRLLPRPVQADEPPWEWWPRWKTISRLEAISVSVAIAVLFLLLLTDDDGYLLLLDTGNLIVHEGGHFVFAVLGDTVSLWGGTLLQLIVPLAVVVYAGRQEEPAGAVLALVWFFQNFLNIARYVGDARAQALPLVGGGIHDWAAILGGMGMIQHDRLIAGWIRTAGWIGMILSWAWYLWRAKRDLTHA